MTMLQLMMPLLVHFDVFGGPGEKCENSWMAAEPYTRARSPPNGNPLGPFLISSGNHVGGRSV